MTLPQLIKAYYDTTDLSEEESIAALDALFDCCNSFDKETFARQNITQEDAETVALSNKDFISDYLSNNTISPSLLASAIKEHPEHFSYYLAMSEPTTATELLEELLYWREQGRI